VCSVIYICMRSSCKANNTVANCQMSSRPSLTLTELHVVTYFCAGIVVSSWIWQKSTVIAWKCYLKRLIFLCLFASEQLCDVAYQARCRQFCLFVVKNNNTTTTQEHPAEPLPGRTHSLPIFMAVVQYLPSTIRHMSDTNAFKHLMTYN